MKKVDISTVILILASILGLSLLVYPIIGRYINASTHGNIVSQYTQQTAQSENYYKGMLDAADDFNKRLLTRKNPYTLGKELQTLYDDMVNPFNNGIMGYIEIPELDRTLPIYHSTSDSVLSAGIGHLEWTSLPVGGESTHSVISGHRGLTGTELFNDLDRLAIGDVFTLQMLGKVLTYQVDQILVVEPNDIDDLTIVEGEDYCTLVTCTPYRINSHRLLVRGTRIENIVNTKKLVSDIDQIGNSTVAICIGAPLFIVFNIVSIMEDRRRYGGAKH